MWIPWQVANLQVNIAEVLVLDCVWMYSNLKFALPIGRSDSLLQVVVSLSPEERTGVFYFFQHSDAVREYGLQAFQFIPPYLE